MELGTVEQRVLLIVMAKCRSFKSAAGYCSDTVKFCNSSVEHSFLLSLVQEL